jgi:hypothetical protein
VTRTPFDRLRDYPVVFRFCAGHRIRAEEIYEDQHGFFPVWPVDSGVDSGTGVSFGKPGRAGSNREGGERAKYGISISHFYWIGAVPAMLFVGVFMMPFYYGSRARSVPEYLKLRFDEKTRWFNAISFAVMTVFSSGVSMYAMGKLLQLLLGWNFTAAILISALIVLAYTFLGGLTSAIYNEVLQFFLIVMGFIPLVYLGLRDAGGWDGLKARIANDAMVHSTDWGAVQPVRDSADWIWRGHARERDVRGAFARCEYERVVGRRAARLWTGHAGPGTIAAKAVACKRLSESRSRSSPSG